ncbi:hypothetical protein ACFE04_016862 [Oxalis oulophora]
MDNKKRTRDDSAELDRFDSVDVKRLRDDLLSNFDDDSAESDPVLYELDSVMKSFQQEITPSSSPAPVIVDLTSDSGESHLDLGYLLGASDDELGLPPVGKTEAELVRVDSDDNGGFWGFEENHVPPEFFAGVENYGEFVVYDDCLFEHNDDVFSSDVSWRSYETL